MKKFLFNTFLISIVLVFLSWFVFSKLLPQFYLPVFPFVVLFFAAVSVFVHAYQLRLAKKDMAKFTRSNMLTTFLKLFLYLTVAIVYIATNRENAKVFVVYFIVLYAIFTVFEVTSLLKITAGDKKKDNHENR